MGSSSGLAAQIDLRGHRQPNLQGMGLQFGRVEAHAYRQALHDLDPVTGGILGRNQ